jgi:hypothetical protein
MISERIAALMGSVASLASKNPIRFSFVPAPDYEPLGYFAKNSELDFVQLGARGFEFVSPLAHAPYDVDILIVTAHGTDISASFWGLRKKLSRDTIIAMWLWDNHISCIQSLRMSLAADFVFPSHRYQASYLLNPISVLALHVPACSAQWSRSEAAQLFSRARSNPRKNKALANYVVYPFSWRSDLLKRLQAEVSEVEAFLMTPDNRARYFSKSSVGRLNEWLSYKTAIILPVDRDVSTRVFDALLAGLVPLVPEMVADFDDVIPPPDQKRLGIVRLPDFELSTIRAAIAEALRIYDQSGADGASSRHNYALNNHMLVHRVAAMLERIKQVGKGELLPAFAPSNSTDAGLQLVQQTRSNA